MVTLLSCLLSFVYAFPSSPVLFIDYGVKSQEKCWLRYIFQIVHDVHVKEGSRSFISYRKYDFDHFPHWMDIQGPFNHGGYTWKPIAIADAFYEWKAAVMWNDSGNYYFPEVTMAIQVMREEGLYIPYAWARLSRGLHIESYRFLRHCGFTKELDLKRTTGRGGFMLFDYRHSVVRDRIMIQWIQCAFTRKCMALISVPKKVHLPEQSVLSVLIYNTNITKSCSRLYNYYSIFQRDTKRENYKITNQVLYGDIGYGANITRKDYSLDQMLLSCG